MVQPAPAHCPPNTLQPTAAKGSPASRLGLTLDITKEAKRASPSAPSMTGRFFGAPPAVPVDPHVAALRNGCQRRETTDHPTGSTKSPRDRLARHLHRITPTDRVFTGQTTARIVTDRASNLLPERQTAASLLRLVDAGAGGRTPCPTAQHRGLPPCSALHRDTLSGSLLSDRDT